MLSTLALSIALIAQSEPKHSFAFRGSEFLLDGKPMQIISGEMHPSRIPKEYWRHRIQMAKAMGCNTIALYLFWNHMESEPGKFDLTSENRDFKRFCQICQEEGMWVLLRPGPYVCGEWELGGLPPYLLRTPDIKLRCSDPRYQKAVSRYVKKLAPIVKGLAVKAGGPVLMVQIENEYGSYGNDKSYMSWLQKTWEANGVDGPFYTADGPTDFMLEAGSLPGVAVGLDSGSSEADWDRAKKSNPGVPVFSSETYPGWLTHWGEKWVDTGVQGISKEVGWLLDNKKSFNLYVLHGGTNFGFTAGANSGGKGYEPDITSYDYDAPIGEQGNATPKYLALRDLIWKARKETPLPIPASIPTMEIPAIKMEPFASIWENLPKAEFTVQPRSFESFGQDYGLRLYRTKLVGHKSGTLEVKEVHDYATVFIDGKYVGKIDRRLGETRIDLPKSTSEYPVLEILVEGMGRINFGQGLIDRKGITDRVVLNGMTLMNWETFGLPLSSKWVSSLKPASGSSKPGLFFRGSFTVDKPADTFLDLSNFKKGMVWVNGHNLGRYWEIGPQNRLYCPAPFLKQGNNEIIAFDLHQLNEGTIAGFRTLK